MDPNEEEELLDFGDDILEGGDSLLDIDLIEEDLAGIEDIPAPSTSAATSAVIKPAPTPALVASSVTLKPSTASVASNSAAAAASQVVSENLRKRQATEESDLESDSGEGDEASKKRGRFENERAADDLEEDGEIPK